MKRPTRPAESKPGGIFQTGSSKTDSKGTDLSYSYQALRGVASTIQSLSLHDGGKSRHAEQGTSNVHSAGSSRSLTRTFSAGPESNRQVQSVHRHPLPCATLVFKNGLLGLANFPSRKMLTFCKILIFSYLPFRLV